MTFLTLTITSYQSQTLGTEAQQRYDQRGGSFGRARDNDWVLPDPERVISGQHGLVYFQDGNFYLKDTSTNGIFVSGRGTPLGRGNSAVLKAGDKLTFGEYEVDVTIDGSVDQDGTSVLSPHGDEEGAVQDVGSISSPNFDPLGEAPSTQPPDTGTFNQHDTDAEKWDSGTSSNHSSALNDVFETPGLHRDDAIPEFSEETQQGPGAGQIPEDYDITGFGVEADPIAKPVPGRQEPQQKSPPSGQGGTPEYQALPASVEEVTPTRAPSPSISSPQSSGDLFDLFMTAAGLDPASLGGLNKEQAMADFGGLFRTVVQGLMELLKARTELKGEFRMSVTTIRAAENNPLKFSPNIDAALATLFVQKGGGYLSPNDAIQESIDDIRAHQIAMITGMQAAFEALMHRVQPESFFDEDGDSNVVKAALMSMNKKSRAWEHYCEFYNQTVRDSGNAFQILFGDDFTQAYEEQVRRLGSSKGN